MTRLERKEAELNKLYEYRAYALKQNNIVWLQLNQDKIDALEKEIIEMRKYEPRKLSEVLADRDESIKNNIYKSLLRISLLADAVNAATFQCREILKTYGLNDFSFRQKIDEMMKLSQNIASVPLACKSMLMEDFIVDNDKFVDMCIKHADAHLKRKLKL